MNIISLVSYSFLPAKTGGQKGIALFYKYFSRFHSVTCISTKKNNSDLAKGYALLPILSNSRLRYVNPFLFFTIRRWIREKQATHLILEHPYYGWLGFLLKKFCGIRLIVHSHNMEGNRWKSLGKWWWKILWTYEKMTHRAADYSFFIQDEDKKYAIREFGLNPESCLTVSFGTEIQEPESPETRAAAGKKLRELYGIPDNRPLLLFNGAFHYSPNLEALGIVLYQVNPLLQKKLFPYHLLIIGMDIPEAIRKAEIADTTVVGFADDLNLYLNGCQIFLNTVVSGGGIKTKLVEAIAFNMNAVSTENGAIGIDPAICNGKLMVCPENQWELFADSIIQTATVQTLTPIAFYNHFYWANITERAARFIESR